MNQKNRPIFEFKKVILGYGGNPVLPEVNLQLCGGDYLGVVGPNGAGKTTLLKALLGILKPLSGTIEKKNGIRFGYVPQREILNELFPLSARDIVSMARNSTGGFKRLFGRSKKDRIIIDHSLDVLGISYVSRKLYRDLSGGQKQRVLIARALAVEPDVLVLDEPTNGMDIRAERGIMEIIDRLNADGLTVIMVTHLLNLVANHARTLMLLNNEIQIGKTGDILDSGKLSETYGGKVSVVEDRYGRKTVIAE